MTFDGWVANAVKAVESCGAAVMVFGAGVVLVRYAWRAARRRPPAYADLRLDLGRVMQIGLEILILGDILRTIVEEPTIPGAVTLIMIVVVRLLLSIGLQFELGYSPLLRRRDGSTAANDGARDAVPAETPGLVGPGSGSGSGDRAG